MKKLIFSLSLLLPLLVSAINQPGRMGVGFSGQLKNDLPSISVKIQQSRGFAISGLFGISTSDKNGGLGLGFKAFKILFEEPQLNFYAGLLGALIKQKTLNSNETGFQADLTVGSEFSFSGLNSLGFSVDFGISMNKLEDFVFETVGNHYFTAAVHFYL